MRKIAIALASATMLAVGATAAYAQMEDMTFFITSVGSGDGANLGGIEGADAHCQALAEAVGAGAATWKAYLSTADENARDRIGSGPWQNAKGVVVAASVDELHGDANNMNKEAGLTENGDAVSGRGDSPNQHDILTGSNADGTLSEGNTCGDWTMNGEGTAMLGHHDLSGPESLATGSSWNAAHASRGCSQEALIGTGGNGYFYCFAAN